MQKKASNPIDTPLDTLVAALAEAKVTEHFAETERIRLEERIAEKITGPDRGQVTETLENGTKVVVKRGYNYKADIADILDYFARKQLDTAAPIKVTAPKLDEIAYEWYRNHNPSVFSDIAKFITLTPKKIAVEIKVKS